MASPDLGDQDLLEVSQSCEETYEGDEFLLGSQSHIEPPALPGLISGQDLNNPFTKAGDEARETQSQATFANYKMPSVQSISSGNSSPTSKTSEGVDIRNLEPLNDPESRATNVKKRKFSPKDMQNLQQILAQRATGVELAPGAGDIFKSLEPADEQSSKIDEEDRDAWMNATIDVEEDAAALYAFIALLSFYIRMR